MYIFKRSKIFKFFLFLCFFISFVNIYCVFGKENTVYQVCQEKNNLKDARNNGIFLNVFLIKDLETLLKINSGFYVNLKGFGCVKVNDIKQVFTNGNLKYIFECVKSNGTEFEITGNEFLLFWDNIVFSAPLTKIMVKRANSGNPDSENRFIVIYAYHEGEDFKKFKILFDGLRKYAEKQDSKLVYMDELGLIPEKSVIDLVEKEKISRRLAFEKIKNLIKKENELFEKGVFLKMPNKFYTEMFSYMAEHKIKSFVEDLDYELWEKIIKFDKLNLDSKAMQLFFSRNFDGYIEYMQKYICGFYEYNVRQRDRLYRKQIEKIMRQYSDALIFTVRGIGHYGMEERINNRTFSVENYVFAEGSLQENLIASQYMQVLWSNGVKMTKNIRELFLLRDFPQEILREFFIDKGLSVSESVRFAVRITENLSKKDIIKFSADIRKSMLFFKIKNFSRIKEFLYQWMVKENKVPQDIVSRFN